MYIIYVEIKIEELTYGMVSFGAYYKRIQRMGFGAEFIFFLHEEPSSK